MSERGLTNQWEPWQRLIDSIGPYYRTQLFAARDRAKDELCDLDEEQLEAIAAEGRKAAGSLDEDGARLTVRRTEHRERHSRLAADCSARPSWCFAAGDGCWRRGAGGRPGPMRRRELIGPTSTDGGRLKRTSSFASSATAAATCTRGSSVTTTSSRAEWPQSSPSTGAERGLPPPRRARHRVAHCHVPHDRPGDRSRPTSGAGQERRRGPSAAAVRGSSRAIRQRAGGSARRAARRSDGEVLDRVLEASPWSSGTGARSRGRRTISGYAPASPSRRQMTMGRDPSSHGAWPATSLVAGGPPLRAHCGSWRRSRRPRDHRAGSRRIKNRCPRTERLRTRTEPRTIGVGRRGAATAAAG